MRAIALDLDGTLLNSDKIISESNKKILAHLYMSGIEIIIVTGRPYATTFPIIKTLDFPTTIICYNGARVMNFKNNEVLFEKTLEPHHTKKIINFSLQNSINLNLFQNDLWYVDDLNSEGTKYYEKNSKMIPHLKNFKTFEDYHMLKAVIIDEPENLKEIEKNLKKILGDAIYYTYSHVKYLELLNREINKGKTLKNVLSKKNIDISSCIAFGDAQNDIEMLSLCGIGVAMGNAHSDLKKCADHITTSNDDDGVAQFLKNNLNLFKKRQE